MKPDSGKPIDYVTLQLRPGDWDKLMGILKAEKYEQSKEGIRKLLLDTIDDEYYEEPSEDGPEPEPASPAVDKLFEYLKTNPDAVKNAAGLGKAALTFLIKKKMGF